MLDFNSAIDAIITLLKTLPGLADEAGGVKHVHKGVPASLPTRLAVYVALADMLISEKVTQRQDVAGVFAVNFGYRVDANSAGAVTSAETALISAVEDFLEAMRLPANRTLGGVVTNAALTSLTASRPEYQIVAGQEYRVYGLLVTSGQSQNY